MLLAYYHALHDRFGDLHWWPGDTPLEILIGAVLTQNTAWANVEKALANLKAHGLLPPPSPPDDLPARQTACAQRLHVLQPAGLAPLIRPAGYFNVKARRLWNLLDWLVTGWQGDLSRLASIPTAELRRQLLAVHGIGPETADSILLYALGRAAFVIDAYTHRVFKRHGLAPRGATYDDLQQLALRNLPPELALWNDFHAQIVMAGKDFCKPTPRCQDCPLRRFLPIKGPRPLEKAARQGRASGKKARSRQPPPPALR